MSVASAEPSTPMCMAPMNRRSSPALTAPDAASTTDDSLMQLSERRSSARVDVRM